jgi:hypothetical protein
MNPVKIIESFTQPFDHAHLEVEAHYMHFDKIPHRWPGEETEQTKLTKHRINNLTT